MANEQVTKVFHAARQDIEIMWHRAKLIPRPIFDTQVAAMVLGYGDSISYDQLVQRITGDMLDKSHRFTDWSRRPLSAAQVTYAISDVTHLRDVFLSLSADLHKRGRTQWVDEEMEVLTSPETYRMEPETAWERLKTRVRKPRELAVLIEVAAWREREAQSRDVPRGRVLKDDALGDIATHAPTTPERLGALRSLPRGFERSKWGADILDAVKRGLARDPAGLPPLDRAAPERQRLRHGGIAEGAAAHDLRAPRRGRQGDRDGRRSRADRRRRPRRRGRAARLAAGIVRRPGDRAQARQDLARGREGACRGGRTPRTQHPEKARQIERRSCTSPDVIARLDRAILSTPTRRGMGDGRSYWVYILASEIVRHHSSVGVTNDLVRRVYEHRTEAVDGFHPAITPCIDWSISSSSIRSNLRFDARSA